MTKTDARILWTGCKRLVLALLTELVLAAAVIGFYEVTITTGYLSVLVFITSLVVLLAAVVLMYAMGLTRGVPVESKGEDK